MVDMNSKKVWLVDSNIYVFKSWYKNPKTLIDKDNICVNAVHGFIDFVYQLLTQEQPQRIGFAFDESLKKSHRREIYPSYKANRKSASPDLRHQFRLCREFLRLMGLAEFGSRYYEADDIIGTLAQHYRNKNYQITLITADKDLTQLIHPNDTWWEYGQNKKMDYHAIKKQFGVRADQIADLLAIAGDKSDNIPGVPDIGLSTAARLLKRFDNLENLIASIPEIGKIKLRRAKYLQGQIEKYTEQMRVSRRLTEIICDAEDAPLQQRLNWDTTQINQSALWHFLDHLNYSESDYKQWLKKDR